MMESTVDRQIFAGIKNPMDERTIDRHSVNCFACGKLVDERECTPGVGFEGDICSECHTGTDEKCNLSANGKHEPEFESISPANIAEPNHWILDVNCRHCGRSGAFRVDLTTEIDW